MMFKLYLLYHLAIFRINVFFSFFFAFFLAPFFIKEYTSLTIAYGVITGFIYAFMTGGFLISAFYFEISRKNEYYFYYNFGISKIRLLTVSYLFNLVFIIPIILIRQYVEASGS